MHFKRQSRSFTAWIAMFAILLGALAPALSHALSGDGQGTRLLQVCTVAGMKMVAVDDAPKKGDLKRFPVERCPFCSIHPGSTLPPAGPAPIIVLGAVVERLPPLDCGARGPLFGWVAASPRAPPVHA